MGLALVGAAAMTYGRPPVSDALASGDVMKGWRVFNEKRCLDCHGIWDQGGRVGPDLGRFRSERLTGGRLAGVMWNHIPKMLAWMKQAGHPPEVMTVEQMTDAFALIRFVQQLDEPGSPLQGERILRAKGCTQCHSLSTVGGTVGPDLAKWGRYANPIIWAQMMWEHASTIEEALKRSDTKWPKLEGADLVHIVAYVRSAGTSGAKTYLRPGSPAGGQKLFAEKKCNTCHPGAGPDLAKVDLPASVGALASRMWLHSPDMTRAMRGEDMERKPVSPQELADILAYVLLFRHQDAPGDPERGKQVFARKGCVKCHEGGDAAESLRPSLQQLKEHSAPAQMATAMWNHGETMLQHVTEAGLSWPVFDGDEMADLLAYLRSVGQMAPVGAETPASSEKAQE